MELIGGIADDLAELVRSYQRVWNSHDGGAVAALFTEDADMVMGADPRAQGRAAIADWWQAYFAGIDRGRTGAFAIDAARLVSPDVAILNVDSTTSGRARDDQRALPTRRARGTWIVVRVGEAWAISALRGQPAVGEARTRAGSDRG